MLTNNKLQRLHDNLLQLLENAPQTAGLLTHEGQEKQRNIWKSESSAVHSGVHKSEPVCVSAYPSSAQRPIEIIEAIACFLAKDMCPLNMVSNEGSSWTKDVFPSCN